MNHKETLVSLLGLPADAGDDAIANSAKTFQAEMLEYKTTTDEQLETLQNSDRVLREENGTLKADKEKLSNTNRTLTEDLVNRDIAEFKDVIVDATVAKEQLLSNREGTLKTLKNLKLGTKAAPQAPLHNRSNPNQPNPAVNAPGEEAITAKKISNRAKEFQKTLKIGHRAAFQMAQAEVAPA